MTKRKSVTLRFVKGFVATGVAVLSVFLDSHVNMVLPAFVPLIAASLLAIEKAWHWNPEPLNPTVTHPLTDKQFDRLMAIEHYDSLVERGIVTPPAIQDRIQYGEEAANPTPPESPAPPAPGQS